MGSSVWALWSPAHYSYLYATFRWYTDRLCALQEYCFNFGIPFIRWYICRGSANEQWVSIIWSPSTCCCFINLWTEPSCQISYILRIEAKLWPVLQWAPLPVRLLLLSLVVGWTYRVLIGDGYFGFKQSLQEHAWFWVSLFNPKPTGKSWIMLRLIWCLMKYDIIDLSSWHVKLKDYGEKPAILVGGPHLRSNINPSSNKRKQSWVAPLRYSSLNPCLW